MNGVETFEHVKEIDPRTTVIIMTGFTGEELLKKAVGAGAYTCLYKPFDMENVMTLVESIIQEKR
jgi:DNA-binding NtrC family response regulator